MAGPNDLIRKNVDGKFDVYVQIQDGTEYDGNYPDFGEALDAFKSSSHILNHYVPPLEKVTFYDAEATKESKMVLEGLLRMTVPVPAGCAAPEGTPTSPDFRVAVQSVREDGVHIIVHAEGHDSDTMDFLVRGNELAEISTGSESFHGEAHQQSNVAEALASWIETQRLLAEQLQQAAKEILAQVAKAEKAPAVAPLIENGENLEQAVRPRRRRRDDGEIALVKCNDLEDELEYQRKLIDRINGIISSPWSPLQYETKDTYRYPVPVHPKDVKENQG